jgi:hypothetical protein
MLTRLVHWLNGPFVPNDQAMTEYFAATGRAMSGGWRLSRPTEEESQRSPAVRKFREARGTSGRTLRRWQAFLYMGFCAAAFVGTFVVLVLTRG